MDDIQLCKEITRLKQELQKLVSIPGKLKSSLRLSTLTWWQCALSGPCAVLVCSVIVEKIWAVSSNAVQRGLEWIKHIFRTSLLSIKEKYFLKERFSGQATMSLWSLFCVLLKFYFFIVEGILAFLCSLSWDGNPERKDSCSGNQKEK